MTIAYDIHEYVQGLSRGTLLAAVLLSLVAYFVGLAVYRLWLSPIAAFPGPKLAALTKWYEFYYDVVLRGKYSDHITELHKIYGAFTCYNPFLVLISGRPNRPRNSSRAPCPRPSIPSRPLHQEPKVVQGPLVQCQSRK
jgi:hypothetical protein